MLFTKEQGTNPLFSSHIWLLVMWSTYDSYCMVYSFVVAFVSSKRILFIVEYLLTLYNVKGMLFWHDKGHVHKYETWINPNKFKLADINKCTKHGNENNNIENCTDLCH